MPEFVVVPYEALDISKEFQNCQEFLNITDKKERKILIELLF